MSDLAQAAAELERARVAYETRQASGDRCTLEQENRYLRAAVSHLVAALRARRPIMVRRRAS